MTENLANNHRKSFTVRGNLNLDGQLHVKGDLSVSGNISMTEGSNYYWDGKLTIRSQCVNEVEASKYSN